MGSILDKYINEANQKNKYMPFIHYNIEGLVDTMQQLSENKAEIILHSYDNPYLILQLGDEQ